MNTNLRRVDADGTQKLERVRVELDSIDGDVCRHFTAAGPVEVLIVADAQPPEAFGRDGMRVGVWALRFPNWPIARKHADRLELLLDALNAALVEAQEAVVEKIPEPDDGHRHVVRFARYQRAVPIVAMCEVCMVELVPDVAAWARDRGLTTSGNVIAEPMNLKNVVEAAVNRIG